MRRLEATVWVVESRKWKRANCGSQFEAGVFAAESAAFDEEKVDKPPSNGFDAFAGSVFVAGVVPKRPPNVAFGVVEVLVAPDVEVPAVGPASFWAPNRPPLKPEGLPEPPPRSPPPVFNEVFPPAGVVEGVEFEPKRPVPGVVENAVFRLPNKLSPTLVVPKMLPEGLALVFEVAEPKMLVPFRRCQ